MDRSDDRSLSAATLPAALAAFGVASAAVDLGAVWIKAPFLRPGVTAGDAIEGAGVFVVLALFLWANRLARGRTILAVAGAVTFAFGRGIHLAGNSLHDLAVSRGAGEPTGLYHCWDEAAGQYVADGARVLVAASLLGVGVSSRATAGARRGAGSAALVLLGGAAYGFITGASAIEGQTVPLVLPFYLLLGGWLAATARAPRPAEARRFFVAATAVALLLLAVWGIWNRGFPEFTRTGILRGAPHSDVGTRVIPGGE